ncbi:hypothetical protein HMPREF9446_03337 [Bacteroides fluxus YIT 12057]|uniref:Uncharacterized protein n=1 Tax=Bacteroides fluxus YIT 12057 TaxID=763034 RepID=F3PX49_9BACE|nr:hypothetical protein HMPREF9446_03337 [Bacteroides fluxus YIT 12057]
MFIIYLNDYLLYRCKDSVNRELYKICLLLMPDTACICLANV